jgi:hypothetical protein
MLLKAIETDYKGVKFRSRLEARWARFFDNLQVGWFYEYEGYETAVGRYLPDFWLPDVYLRNVQQKGVYLEIKPDDFGCDHAALEEVCCTLNKGGILAAGFRCNEYAEWEGVTQIAPWWDDSMLLYKCGHCGAVKFEFSETNYMECPVCERRNYNASCENVVWAADEASKYRFWG